MHRVIKMPPESLSNLLGRSKRRDVPILLRVSSFGGPEVAQLFSCRLLALKGFPRCEQAFSCEKVFTM